jgi:hypothetical protein
MEITDTIVSGLISLPEHFAFDGFFPRGTIDRFIED